MYGWPHSEAAATMRRPPNPEPPGPHLSGPLGGIRLDPNHHSAHTDIDDKITLGPRGSGNYRTRTR